VIADEQELIELEHEGWRALCTSAGADYYRDRLARDALMAFPFGILGRDDALAAMASAEPWERYALHDVRVLALGDGAAAVVYRADAQRPGAAPFRATISSVYVREDGEWKLALHQQSVVDSRP
jgi:hypothetical protein